MVLFLVRLLCYPAFPLCIYFLFAYIKKKEYLCGIIHLVTYRIMNNNNMNNDNNKLSTPRLTDEQIESRVAHARELFHQGFNCSQSVFAACADLYGITDESLALRLAASFGGGIGRMRQTCGAACGMFLLAGLETGSSTPSDPNGKAANYAFVQDLAAQFKQHQGSLICAELLGIAPAPQSPTPEQRTDTYYKHRPCADIVADTVRLYLRNLSQPSCLTAHGEQPR